ncbi:methyltransferase domain-containing protein [Streptomyces goshikiensis]|uniref:methyltransferase domain-containing protein n=1 Tax=Streptomyces goshikiensis TaxID=1942 RepID=UPI00367F96E5
MARLIADALGGARTVVNAGAGAGAYETAAAAVTAVEPSESMRAQRSAALPRAVDAVAKEFPFEDGQFDGAMTLFSVHQWSDAEAGRGRCGASPAPRSSCSPATDGVRERFTTRLREDLDSGAWDERFGHLRTQPARLLRGLGRPAGRDRAGPGRARRGGSPRSPALRRAARAASGARWWAAANRRPVRA